MRRFVAPLLLGLGMLAAVGGSPDDDNDGVPNDEDCRPTDPDLWAPPAAPVTDLELDRSGATSNLSWSRPSDLGGIPGSERYDTLISSNPAVFGYPGGFCGEINSSALFSSDPRVPEPGRTSFYLTRVENVCGTGPVDSVPPPVQPRTTSYLEVTNTNDSGAGSLREMIAGTSGGEAICFDVSDTIALSSGPLSITSEMAIAGPGADLLTVDGGGASSVFDVVNAVEISGLTISGADRGIFMAPPLSGEVVITNDTISGNTTGIHLDAYLDADVEVRNSTIEQNSGHGFLSYAYYSYPVITNSIIRGNGVGVEVGYSYYSTTSIRNSTITQNAIGVSVAYSDSDAEVIHSTIVDNDIGISVHPQSFARVFFSILDNTLDCDPDAGGFFGVQNLYAAATNCTVEGSDLVGDPLLGGLGNHGGPTDTFPLLTGSPAIDAAACLFTRLGDNVDQRGFPRRLRDPPLSGETHCDLGAYEKQ